MRRRVKFEMNELNVIGVMVYIAKKINPVKTQSRKKQAKKIVGYIAMMRAFNRNQYDVDEDICVVVDSMGILMCM